RLDRASLVGARLVDASLDDASLVGARLVGASLDRARLVGARLDGARLDGASLVGARLDGARLVGARLGGASLDGASLDGARLKPFERDIRLLLHENPAEVPGLLAAVRAGKINGSAYNGECACLVGTLAKVRGCPVETLEQDSSRPAEQFFFTIQPGHTPETHQPSKLVETWILDWQRRFHPEQLADQDKTSEAG
ncbi:MAG TPA: pentapeptide repeat-containing protein, partial [Gemmatimonadales bacterium]|nr:pentapeptide repeat-containing protein [Gemmatimonadales bacterium]